MPPADHASTRWQVALPTGTEGPYTASELRGLVMTGRVKPDDHLTDLDSRRSATVRDVVPDADTLAVGTERIRRRSGASGRQPAASSGTGSDIRRLRTPLPGMADPHAPPQVAQAIVQATAPTPRRQRRRFLLIATLLFGLVALATIMAVWPPAWPQDPGLQPYGAWQTGAIGKLPGSWLVVFAEDGVAITGADGKRFWSEASLSSVHLHEVQAVLGTPHPLLGDRLTLRGSDSVTLTTSAGGASASPIR